jgi:D-alanyl-D-alanine dipeptidase
MLVEIAPPTFDVDLALRYATADNLTGQPVYRRALALLHPAAAARLAAAAGLARGIGCRLCLYDAFRPVEAQWRLWRAFPDPAYIADPRIGSSHSRGVAVDLTLTDSKGQELDMGTAFDDMSVRSHLGRTDLPGDAQRHRALLLGVMVAAGWQPYSEEWWHFQLPGAGEFPLLWDGAGGPALMR